MRIVYQDTCFPFDAYSMGREVNEVHLVNVHKEGRGIAITCLTVYEAKRLVDAIRKAYKDGEKIFSVDAWLGRA